MAQRYVKVQYNVGITHMNTVNIQIFEIKYDYAEAANYVFERKFIVITENNIRNFSEFPSKFVIY